MLNAMSRCIIRGMASMKVMQVSKAGAPFDAIDRPIPEPGENEIRIKVEACGLCHSDRLTKHAMWPGIQLPRIPGHEVVGTVDAVGSRVKLWKTGERVGVGWHGGHCFVCEPCRRGDFVSCHEHNVTGITRDGGYSEYMLASEHAAARVPDALTPAEAAPLMCAGITVFNAMRNSGARSGDLVAIQGIGGLGHLGVQFANKMGFHTVAISRGADKEELAASMGAHHYIDAAAKNVSEELQKLGGARVIVATAPNSKAISSVVDGLGIDGTILVIGATPEPIEVSPFQVIGARKGLRGWPSGTAKHSEETLAFCALTGIRPHIETYPLAQADAAYERMVSNEARFRVVLTAGS